MEIELEIDQVARQQQQQLAETEMLVEQQRYYLQQQQPDDVFGEGCSPVSCGGGGPREQSARPADPPVFGGGCFSAEI